MEGDAMPGFDWDAGNLGEIAKHGVTREEAEEAATDPRAVFYGTDVRHGEWRVELIGATRAGRIVTVVVTPRGDRTRVVSAFPARPRYARIYQQQED
jgi:uncharacterized DUF497 family protein